MYKKNSISPESCHYITREQAYSGNEIGALWTHVFTVHTVGYDENRDTWVRIFAWLNKGSVASRVYMHDKSRYSLSGLAWLHGRIRDGLSI